MKKNYPTVIHNSAETQDKIYVSGGKIGMQLLLSPLDLQKVSGAVFADVIREK